MKPGETGVDDILVKSGRKDKSFYGEKNLGCDDNSGYLVLFSKTVKHTVVGY